MKFMYSQKIAVIFIAALCLIIFTNSAQSIQSNKLPGQIVWPDISLGFYMPGFDNPVHLTHAGDNTHRLFVVEQVGRIKIIQNNQIQPFPFLDIRERVRSPWHEDGGGTEEGLLSIAFPPNYTQTGHLYVYYTNLNGDNVVARFSTTSDPNIADPDSEYQILYLEHPIHQNHNGGQLAFGPDEFLYIGTGDGGGGGDPEENAQDPNSMLGKILRIDVNGPLAPYSIPPSNPFTQTVEYQGEIWALGLRNPWRFSFDRDTNDLFIGDVGQNRREEIDYQAGDSSGGENYGWDILEGSLCFEPPNDCVPPESNVYPVSEYEHGANNSLGCSVSGGYVYRGRVYPRMQGIYYYADYCTGKIWGLQQDEGDWINTLLLDSDQPYTFSSFGEDEMGNLYIADRMGGVIYRISDSVPQQKYHIPLVYR